MDTGRTYEVVLRVILLACLAGIIVLVVAQVFIETQVPLAVAVTEA